MTPPHHGGAGPPSRASAISGGAAAVFPDSPLLQSGTDDGKALATGTWQQYVGVLSELKVYKRLLSEDEVGIGHEQSRGRYASDAFTVVAED